MVQFIRIAVATLLDQRKGVKTDISALSNSSNWHILSSWKTLERVSFFLYLTRTYSFQSI